MKKKLVFHFYCDSEWENNQAVKLHLKCLEYFSHIFDDAVVVISTNDISNKDMITSVKKKIICTLDVPSLTIKVKENTPFREAQTYHDEVLGQDYDGIVFFAHTKGYTNFGVERYNKDYLTDWILGAYWLSLSFLDEVEETLSFSTECHNAFFYGSFLTSNSDNTLYLNAVYSGSFYWTNMASIRNELFLLTKKLPEMGNRMFAEEFPGIICLSIFSALATGHNAMRIKQEMFNFYGEEGKLGPVTAIEVLCLDKDEGYGDFKNEMLKKGTICLLPKT